MKVQAIGPSDLPPNLPRNLPLLLVLLLLLSFSSIEGAFNNHELTLVRIKPPALYSNSFICYGSYLDQVIKNKYYLIVSRYSTRGRDLRSIEPGIFLRGSSPRPRNVKFSFRKCEISRSRQVFRALGVVVSRFACQKSGSQPCDGELSSGVGFCLVSAALVLRCLKS